MKKLLLITLFLGWAALSFAAKVDTLLIKSPSMNKDVKVVVVTPDVALGKKALACPVLYLLHGYGGNAKTWIGIKPNLPQIADEKGMIFVCPDGKNSWYWDSPLNPSYRYETFISSELVTTDSDTEDADSSDTEDDSEEEETKTVTVDKEITIYVGDETGSDRYVKVDDSKEVYTITEDSLTDILDSTVSDFYSLSVNYLSVNSLDSLEVKTPNGDHTVTVTRETTKDSADEEAEETTTVSYKLDGADLDDTTFTTFYNDCPAASHRRLYPGRRSCIHLRIQRHRRQRDYRRVLRIRHKLLCSSCRR